MQIDIVQAIKNLQGKSGQVALLTDAGVEVFEDLDQAEERIGALDGNPYAVVRLLWTGGEKRAGSDPIQPDHEKRRQEADRQAREGMSFNLRELKSQHARSAEMERLPSPRGLTPSKGRMSEE